MYSLLSLLASAICITSTFAQNSTSGLLVSTQQGDVQGTQVNPSARQFLGIPYATAARWTAPKSPAKRNETLIADHFGDSCIQQNSPANLAFVNLTSGEAPNVTESEDCLSVNIWVPSTSRKQKTAVMIWIYGGGFNFGTSNTPTYDGQHIVQDNDDVSVVSFNYRLNIFGQPNAPQLANSTTDSQNFGLLDINAAVKWVYDNIASFGGDPERITLFGQSAGGTAIDAYTFSHLNDTMVKGVIEHSGSISGGNFAQLVTGIDTQTWNNISNLVGCSSGKWLIQFKYTLQLTECITVPDDVQFECMKQVPARTLEEFVTSTNAAFNIVPDNITIFSNTDQRAKSGNFLKIPLLVGSTANDGDILAVIGMLLSPLGFAPPLVTELAADTLTELSFTCPTNITAQNRLDAGVPTWRYQYQGVFRDISTRPDLRAYHASELPLIFGTLNPNSPTTEELALSKYMQSAWVAFARDPQKGLSNFGWPNYDPATQSLVQLGNFYNRSSATFGSSAEIDIACSRVEILANISAQVNSLLAP
ncbi:hypothetical protein NP233_g8425 [Leucocoprinus birnbaumii]|uniref:Carboxylic ester hydrolase n=1 Tax=Leucocoprinus birnbaumii TaxID=56174 RepID=A0AAD5VP13_9AGAR|nr:hypothetical protein NP233_g8425 [Leucocoprinus birnbaumii]